jgi:hypothetical protein
MTRQEATEGLSEILVALGTGHIWSVLEMRH